ncbi:MAG: acylphosphatase [Candidatus Omnitrophica bacterium]|nr:acylphosphatase [Candidatus Omnitrophota bacterium]
MPAENKRIHVYYSGRVQGVGFRFTAQALAQDLNLIGWVKNLPRGGVETVCEGKEEDLRKFLSKIDDAFSGYIRQKNVNWMPASGEFAGFEIKFF